MAFMLGGIIGGMVPIYLIAALLAWCMKIFWKGPLKFRLWACLPFSTLLGVTVYTLGEPSQFQYAAITYSISGFLLALLVAVFVRKEKVTRDIEDIFD